MARRFVLAWAIVLTLLAPTAVKAQTAAESIAADIDAWWSAEFSARGLTYTSPRVELVSEPGTEFCGPIDVFYAPAGYCATSQTITVSTGFVSPDAVAALLPLISHEWGHHIQWQVDTGVTSSLEAEQQADCFAGAYMSHAQALGLVSPEAVSMALSLTQAAGDVWFFLPDDAPEHGNKAERALAFMRGLNGGVADCGFPA